MPGNFSVDDFVNRYSFGEDEPKEHPFVEQFMLGDSVKTLFPEEDANTTIAPKTPDPQQVEWGTPQQLSNALMLGYGENVAASGRALLGEGAGAGFAERYKDVSKKVAGAKRVYESENPTKALMTDIGGSLLPVALALRAGQGYLAAPAMARIAASAPRLARTLGYLGAPVEGAAAGALTSGLTETSTEKDIGYGAIANTVLRPLLGQLAKPLVSAVSPSVAYMAEQFMRLGVPLKAAQIPGAPAATKLFSGTSGQQKEAFTRAVSRTIGEDSPTLHYDHLFGPAGVTRRIGGEMDNITGSYAIPHNEPGLARDIARIRAEAQADLASNPAELARVELHLSNLETGFSNPAGVNGEIYQNFTRYGSPLYRDMSSKTNANLSHYAGEIKGAVDDAWSRSLPADILDQWNLLKRQYKNVMSIKPALDETTELVDPSKLFASVKRKNNGSTAGAQDLGILAEGGKNFLAPHAAGGPLAHLAGRHPIATMGAAGAVGGGSATAAESIAGLAQAHPYAAAGLAGLGTLYGAGGAALSRPWYADVIANTGGRGFDTQNILRDLILTPTMFAKPGYTRLYGQQEENPK